MRHAMGRKAFVLLMLLPFAWSCSKKSATAPGGGSGGGGGGGGAVRSLTLTTSRTQIQPNGVDYATLRATAADSAGRGVANLVVRFTSKLGTGVTISPDSGLTDSTGQVVTTLKSTRAGVDSITAAVSTYTAKVQVNYTGYTLVIDSLAQSVPPGQPTVVRATLRDSVGNPVQGTLLYFTVSAGHSSQIFNVDSLRRSDSNGHGRAPYIAGPTTGFDTVTVTESQRNLSDRTVISIGGGAPEDTIPAAILIESVSSYFLYVKGGGGVESSIIKVKVLNRNGTYIKKAVRVDFTFVQPLGGGEFFAPSSGNTDPATGTLSTALNSGTKSGTLKFKATVYGRTPPIETAATLITIRSGPPDPAHFTILSAECTLPGRTLFLGDETTITVFLADLWGNPPPEHTTVWFSTNQCMIYPGSAETDNTGKCTNQFRTALPNDSSYATVTAQTRDSAGQIISKTHRLTLYGNLAVFTLYPPNNTWTIDKPGGVDFVLTAQDDRGIGLPGKFEFWLAPEGFTNPTTITIPPTYCTPPTQHAFLAADTVSTQYSGKAYVTATWTGLRQSFSVVDTGQIIP